MKISVCWITKNEELNIARSINSYKDHVDEMIVVDTGSTDDTVKIAEALGAKVERFQWNDDFSAARNFALSLSTGDVIMCPDADMWYEPAFSQRDRDLIENALKPSAIDGVTGIIIDVDTDRGVVLNEAMFTLAFKRSAGLSYHNPIHEQLLHKDGSFMEIAHIPEIKIRHSGYSQAKLNEKAERNISMLEVAAGLEEEKYGGAHKAITDFYIMRENMNYGKYDAAFKGFMALHRNSSAVKDLVPYRVITTTYFFMGLRLAAAMRTRVSRLDIYNNLVLLLKKMFPKYDGSHMMDLFYCMHFDLKDDVFLNEIKSLSASFNPNSENSNGDSVKAFAMLCSKAAVICRRRGELQDAFDHCIKRMEVSDIFDPDVFSILLTCIKGQDESEIIVFLNSLFGSSTASTKAHALAEGLMQDGFQLIFKYFVMKQAEKGIALKKHFLQLLILNGNYEEALDHALSMKSALSDDLLSELVFLALVCSDNLSPSPEVRRQMNPVHSRLYDFMTGTAVTDENTVNLREVSEVFIYGIFNQLAFFSGLGKAYTFLRLFSKDARACFMVEAKYAIENSLYDRILLSEFAPRVHDEVSKEILLLARILTGRHEEAMVQIRESLFAYKVNQDLLNHLLTLAEKGKPEIAKEARALYDKHAYLYDEFTDLEDVIRTGLVFDRFTKQDRKTYVGLDWEAFMLLVRSDPYVTDHLSYLMTIEQAARIYEEKGMAAMALHYTLRLYSCGYRENEMLGNLARLFGNMGNKSLAERLRNDRGK